MSNASEPPPQSSNPSLDNPSDDAMVFAVKEFMRLRDTGIAPPAAEFAKRYPELGESLLLSLEGLELLEQRVPSSNIFSQSHFGASSFADVVPAPSALGDFRILREIGRGGMGTVYEAEQLSLGRRVAIKVLSVASGLDPVRLQRFRNEAQAAAQLHHTHIVPVYAVGVDRGVHYYAMQLIEGRTFAQVIDALKQARTEAETAPSPSRKLSAGSNTDEPSQLNQTQEVASTRSGTQRDGRDRYFRNVAQWMIQAASGLRHAHQYGIVHRDIKPANLLLDAVNNVWIADFGLAQIQSDSNLTRTGDMLGTLRYMSPEQASGGELAIDHRTDIYSLGVTLYELLTLQPAVRGTGYHELINQITQIDPPSPRSLDPSIPIELAIICQKAIAKNPRERYDSMDAFAEDLQRWKEDKPIAARAPTFWHRAIKWRRRHATLVTAAGIFGGFAALVCFATTILVLNEQRKTSIALRQERQNRLQADVNFQEARRAVDTFYDLSEAELANRSDLKSLRREFLETSLEFYQGFIESRRGDPTVEAELSESMFRVELLVSTMEQLDRLEPLLLLSYQGVRKEIELSEELEKIVVSTMEKVGDNSLDELQPGGETASLLDSIEFVASRLTDSQLNRLREIDRQSRLPFTFKSYDIARELHLTQVQRKEIGRIIEEERPDRAFRKQMAEQRAENGERKDGELQNRPPKHFPPLGDRPPRRPPPRRDDDSRMEEEFPPHMRDRPPFGGPKGAHGPGGPPGPHGREGPGGMFGEFGPPGFPGEPFPHELVRSQTNRTVERILEVLSREQRARWDELVGKPFVPK